jgi:hypothetical protein
LAVYVPLAHSADEYMIEPLESRGILPSHNHVVQFYQADADLLIMNVGTYIAEGLKRRESILAIATSAHAAAFAGEVERSGQDAALAIAENRLVFLDADKTLGQFMLNGHPDGQRFDAIVREVIGRFPRNTGVRAYGEMVGLLWQRGSFSAAIYLEELWNKLLTSVGLQLFCAYPIDIFDREFQVRGVDAVLCDHTHVVPSCSQDDLDRALNRALDEVLGERVHAVRPLMTAYQHPSWGVIPAAEANILWLRNNLSGADVVIDRAREYYNASRRQSTGQTA